MKKKLQGVILIVGIILSIFAYATTPQVETFRGNERPCSRGRCYIPAAAAAVRGGGTVLLVILAFAGVSVMYKDED